MHLALLDQVADPPTSANADHVAAAPDMAVWLDGAAPFDARRLFDQPCDAAWFVRRFAESLLARPRDGRATQALVADAQAEAAKLYEAALVDAVEPPAERPFACLGTARLVDRCLELTNLGDCCVFVVPPSGGVTRFGYSTVANLDADALEEMQRIRSTGHLSHAAAFAEVRSRILENRAKRNLMFGYDVIEPLASASVRAERMLLPAVPGTRLLAMSDGFARAVDLYGLVAPADVVDVVARGGVAGMIARIRAVEDADPEATRFPRLKLRDDATAALFEIREGPSPVDTAHPL